MQGALEAAQGGNITAACHQLAAFIAEVRGQAGKALTADQADQLIAAATSARAFLGCS